MMLQRSPGAARHDRKRRAKREQMRRYRQRERDGVRIAIAPFDGMVVNYLVATGWLDAAFEHDPRAIGKAYFALVRDSARRDPIR
jgi:hypothetical protein